ncbi:extensin-like [Pollicipes pollicipes]|uniref:extensin-like n=1 Tax=Pollicipes pollicipes TaxID=41117 RepID=UPI0018855CB0|nr:extensin-like [Pollicipes pollicipes]
MKVFIVAAVLAVAAAAPAPDSPPTYKPAPPTYRPTPAPYKPAPAPYKPAPAPYKPAPAPYKPAPAPYRPAPSYKPAPYHPEPQYKEEAKPYAFDYAVNDHYSGANFAANENSDGKQTSGYYKVALPDGRVQTVNYVADHYGGYNAEVTYEGEAQYPEYKPAPASYKPAPASYKPAPAPYKPAPAPYKPAPAPYKPAPAPYRPFGHTNMERSTQQTQVSAIDTLAMLRDFVLEQSYIMEAPPTVTLICCASEGADSKAVRYF